MAKLITSRQETVLGFIRDFIRRRGFPPTVREIAAHLKITSLKAVDRHLEALEKKGYIRRTQGISRAIELVGANNANIREIPIAGVVRAGMPHPAIENIENSIALDASLVRHPDSFFLRVKGDSMIEAHIQEGDLVLIRPQTDVQNGDIVVVLIGDEATLKIFYREKNYIRLQPANSHMEPILVGPDDPPLSIVGKVVGLFRETDHISGSKKKWQTKLENM